MKNTYLFDLADKTERALRILFVNRMIKDFNVNIGLLDIKWAASTQPGSTTKYFSWIYIDGQGYMISLRTDIALLINTMNMAREEHGILRGDQNYPGWYLDAQSEPDLPYNILDE